MLPPTTIAPVATSLLLAPPALPHLQQPQEAVATARRAGEWPSGRGWGSISGSFRRRCSSRLGRRRVSVGGAEAVRCELCCLRVRDQVGRSATGVPGSSPPNRMGLCSAFLLALL
uniref:Uncharacterized protein n=1 Tax=Arundo donax TaxID=35708 RepID=A0A0A9AK14_ARUDO